MPAGVGRRASNPSSPEHAPYGLACPRTVQTHTAVSQTRLESARSLQTVVIKEVACGIGVRLLVAIGSGGPGARHLRGRAEKTGSALLNGANRCRTLPCPIRRNHRPTTWPRGPAAAGCSSTHRPQNCCLEMVCGVLGGRRCGQGGMRSGENSSIAAWLRTMI